MKYVGIQTQVRQNNQRTIAMLLLFPVLVLALVWLFFFVLMGMALSNEGGSFLSADSLRASSQMTLNVLPWVFGICLLWFAIAYFVNVSIIKKATHSHSLERASNKRVYNLVENLCMTQGMAMPKLNIIEDGSLNAFASGINDKTYTVTLTRGIIQELNDEELEGVIAHELCHIRNRDVRLLIVSIVFVGIFSTVANILLHSLARGSNKKNNMVLILLGLAIASLGVLLSSLMRFFISRKREYMADAGAAQMTKKPYALAAALKKISGRSAVSTVSNKAVSQLFIENALNKKSVLSLFATHPPIQTRIQVLEQF